MGEREREKLENRDVRALRVLRKDSTAGYISIQSKFSAGEENALARFNNEKGQKKIGIAWLAVATMKRGGEPNSPPPPTLAHCRHRRAEVTTVIHLGARFIIIASSTLPPPRSPFVLVYIRVFLSRADIMPPPQLFGSVFHQTSVNERL